MMTNQLSLIEQMLQLTPRQGIYPSLAPAVTLVRSDAKTERAAILYQPVFYIVLQGQKRSYLGEELYQYDPLNFLALSVPLPMEGHVSKASQAEPYLAIKIELEPMMVHEVLLALPEFEPAPPADRGVCICPMSQELSQTVTRLLNSLTDPRKAAVVAPMLIKEAIFYALLGPQGAQLSAFVTQGRQHQRIAKVLRHIQSHFKHSLDIEALAELASMSPSSFHQHFKAVTNTSPLQYIKALRLHQAQHLVALTNISVSEAAYQVGYQSLSQFSREYKRFFGQAPSHALES